MEIVCNGKEIVAKDSVKYLGAILDQDMSGQSMGTTALKKINKCLKLLYRKADSLDSKCRKMLCQALLQSHFDYSCNVWFRSFDKRLQNRLQCAQNKIIRYILKYDSRHHLECSDFAKLNFLNVSSRVDYLSCSMIFNIFHNTAPEYLCNVHLVDHVQLFILHYTTCKNSGFKFICI